MYDETVDKYICEPWPKGNICYCFSNSTINYWGHGLCVACMRDLI